MVRLRATDRDRIRILLLGGLIFVTFPPVFVFMAFTLILIPVSILGLLVGMLMVGYGIIALGYLLGQQVETSRVGLATGVGIVAVTALLEVSSVVPFVGGVIAIGLVLTGFGAVVSTYFGLGQFEPNRGEDQSESSKNSDDWAKKRSSSSKRGDGTPGESEVHLKMIGDSST